MNRVLKSLKSPNFDTPPLGDPPKLWGFPVPCISLLPEPSLGSKLHPGPKGKSTYGFLVLIYHFFQGGSLLLILFSCQLP